MTALMRAAAGNRPAVCQLLIERGADLSVTVRGKPTPPHRQTDTARVSGHIFACFPLHLTPLLCFSTPSALNKTPDSQTALFKAVAAGAKDSAVVVLVETQKRAADEAAALRDWIKSKGLEAEFQAALPKAAAAVTSRISAQERFEKLREEARQQQAARLAAARAEEEEAAKAEEARAAEELVAAHGADADEGAKEL